MKKQSFVLGAMILLVCAIVCKILGAVYRIPLTNILGAEGMGLYYLIFPIYSFMLTVSSASFPTAISHLVSENIATKNYKKTNTILKASILLLTLLGIVCTLIVFLLARPMATLQARSEAYFGYYIIAPSILFVAILSAFRGYFQGLQNMTPSGVSQIIEQITKLIFGLVLAHKLVGFGVVYGVVGALLGITISECFALMYIVIRYAVFKKHNPKQDIYLVKTNYSIWSVSKEIFLAVIPYMLGSIIYPLAILIDSFLIINLLKRSGLNVDVATSLFGINNAVVGTLTNLPTVVSTSLAMSIVPSITAAMKKDDKEDSLKKAKFSIKICMLISIPCSIIFAVFSKQIVGLLFSSGLKVGEIDEFGVACGLLSIAGVQVIYLCLLQVLTAILQAINRPYLPVISLAVGVIVKIVCECVLIMMPRLNIYGAVVSSIICYMVVCIIDLVFVKKYLSITFSICNMFICPLVASIAMGLTIYGLDYALGLIVGSKIATVGSFVVGGLVYIGGLIVGKAFDKDEVKFFKKLKPSKK